MIGILLGLIVGVTSICDAECDYRDGRFAESRRQFEKVLSSGEEASGPILYNLGNCSYRLGRLADSIYYYRRALIRLPGDRELLFNLRLVEKEIGLEVASDSHLSAIETMLAAFPPGRLLGLLGILQAFGLIGLVFFRNGWARTGSISLVLIALSGALWLARTEWFPGRIDAVVIADSVEVRAGPHPTLAVTDRLKAGRTVAVAEMSDRWVRIADEDGGGWIPRFCVGVVD